MSLRPQCENARHRHVAGMADAEPPSSHSQRRGGSRRAARESDLRRRARCAVDHYIGESNPRPEAGAERLQHGLLRSKPTRQALGPVDPIADFIQLGLHEATWNQRVARILYPPPYLSDVNQVDTVSDNVHKSRFSSRRSMN